jgi:hypothetical protein
MGFLFKFILGLSAENIHSQAVTWRTFLYFTGSIKLMQHGKSKIRSRLLRLSADLMQMGITGGKSISVSTHRSSGSDKGTEFPRRTENNPAGHSFFP